MNTFDEKALHGARESTMGRLMFRLYRIHALRNFALRWALRTEGNRFHSKTVRRILNHYHGVEVGAYSYGGRCMRPGAMPRGVSIGRYVSIAQGVRVFLRDHPLDHLSTHPFFFNRNLGVVQSDKVEESTLRIEHDAWVGENVIITAGCHRIGIGAVVGAGSVVTKDVPDFAIVAGAPAKFIRFRFHPDIQHAVLQSKWWELSMEELRQYGDVIEQPLTRLPLQSIQRCAA